MALVRHKKSIRASNSRRLAPFAYGHTEANEPATRLLSGNQREISRRRKASNFLISAPK